MKLRHILILGVLIVALVVFGLPRTPFAAEVMRAHFINVGLADTTLLEFPCGAILIDAIPGNQKCDLKRSLGNLSGKHDNQT